MCREAWKEAERFKNGIRREGPKARLGEGGGAEAGEVNRSRNGKCRQIQSSATMKGTFLGSLEREEGGEKAEKVR